MIQSATVRTSPARPSSLVAACRQALIVVGLSLWTPWAHAQITGDTVARRLLTENRFDEALVAIDSEIRQRPKDGQLWLLKGAAYSLSNRKDAAIRVFSDMIANKMELASAYNNLAVIHADRGEFEQAERELEAALQHKPDYAVARHNLGNVYANMAALAYRRALQLDRNDPTLPTKLSQLGEVLGKTFDLTTPPPPQVAAAPSVTTSAQTTTPNQNTGSTPVAFKWENSTPAVSVASKGNIQWGNKSSSTP